MEQVFGYIIGLGAAVMMPIIFTILGVCIGIKFSKALKSGLLVGVGFVGLSVVTALLTSSLGPALSQVVEIYGLQLKVFDMGWPAAAAVAYNTSVGAFIIPVCLGVNLLMLLTKTTRTVNIDLWNYWHFAFIGAVVYFASDNIWWGFFAAIICYIITLIMADYTADKFQGFYDKMEGISIPQPFCAGFVPFAVVINKALDKIPGFDKLNIDAEGMKKKSREFAQDGDYIAHHERKCSKDIHHRTRCTDHRSLFRNRPRPLFHTSSPRCIREDTRCCREYPCRI